MILLLFTHLKRCKELVTISNSLNINMRRLTEELHSNYTCIKNITLTEHKKKNI